MAITAMPAAAHVRANLKICFRSIMSSLREDRPEGLYYTCCRPGSGRLRSPSLSHLTARVAPNPAGMAIMIHTFRILRFTFRVSVRRRSMLVRTAMFIVMENNRHTDEQRRQERKDECLQERDEQLEKI